MGGTVHGCHGLVRTSDRGSRFDTISVQQEKKKNLLCSVSFHLFWTDSSANLIFFFFSSRCENTKYYYMLYRAVPILDFSYHGYCGHNNSRYRYITVSIETLGGGDMSNYFLLCLLSFSFSPNEHKDTDKHRAQDSVFLCLLWSSYEITREKILSSSTAWWININGHLLTLMY